MYSLQPSIICSSFPVLQLFSSGKAFLPQERGKGTERKVWNPLGFSRLPRKCYKFTLRFFEHLKASIYCLRQAPCTHSFLLVSLSSGIDTCLKVTTQSNPTNTALCHTASSIPSPCSFSSSRGERRKNSKGKETQH